MPAPGGFPGTHNLFHHQRNRDRRRGTDTNPPPDHSSTTMNPTIIEAMIKYGGSFVRSLGQAALAADPENRRRIAAAWPELVAQYSAMAGEEPAAAV